MSIKILIADDHRVLADALRHFLERQPDFEIVGCVENGADAVARAVADAPDIVLMDHVMPVLDGTEATRAIVERCPRTRVVMLSMYSDAARVHHALQAGASGYVVKSAEGDEVIRAVLVVHAGKRYLSERLAVGVARQGLALAD